MNLNRWGGSATLQAAGDDQAGTALDSIHITDMTTREAKEALGVGSDAYIRQLVERGRLKGRKASDAECAVLLASGRIQAVPHSGVLLISSVSITGRQSRKK